MRGQFGTSLELFTLNGKRIFSQTYVRPREDAVGIEHKIELPADKILCIGDKVGVVFPDAKDIPLYVNPDGIFDLP